MTIVASNSLTVSNVNDGTITHYAYANSADGTDGFYIGGGSNLLTGTSIDLIVDDSSNTNLGWKFASVYNGLIAGYVYTFSSEVSVLGSATSIDVRPYNPKTGMTITDSYTTFSIVDGKISGLVKPRDGYTQLLIYAGNQGNTHGNKVTFHHMKLEKGSTATPWSPAPSEAHPSYIGQYTDFSSTASTDPDKYAPWTVFKGDDGKDGVNGNDGIAGKDGVGIKTTTITYAGSTSGTTAPTSGWTSTVPTVAAGSYLWTKTLWTYTDNSFETGYSVAKMGNNGATGPRGPAGSDGNPGKIVSDTEPTTRFKDLTWKYSGTTDLTASDGTIILSGTEYYWNGNNWVINLIKAQNINVDTLSAITAVLGDMFGGSLTISKSNTQGIAVKDGVVKSWDISKMTDPNYPDGYSYTSMGVALDSGGLTIYSAGYGHTLDKGGVIDSKYKVASLQAIAGNGRQNSGTGLILEANDSDFPFTVDGNIDVTGVVNQSYKQATVNFGYGRNVTLTRNGNYVTITSQNRYTIAPPNGTWLRNIATLPSGYRPVDDVLIYNHELSNSSKFSWSLLHPSGAIDLFSSGNITTTDYILSSSQCWITNDAMPS